MNRRYRVNEPAVVAELHDGDAIFINFENGRYYDTAGTGGEIVRLLLEARTVSEIASELVRLSSVSEREVAGTVAAFVESLTAEGLMIPTDAPVENGAPGPIHGVLPHGFMTPVLNRHVELEDLLQIDPIHDTDDAGWPVPQASDRKLDEGT